LFHSILSRQEVKKINYIKSIYTTTSHMQYLHINLQKHEHFINLFYLYMKSHDYSCIRCYNQLIIHEITISHIF